MSLLLGTVLYFGAMLLQWWWNTHFSAWGAAPQFLLVLTVLLAARRGPVVAMLAGFGWGLYLDVSRAELFGANALLLTLSGYAAGMVRRQLDLRAVPPLVATTVLLTWAGLLLHGFLGAMFSKGFEHFRPLIWIATPLLNAVFVTIAGVAWELRGER